MSFENPFTRILRRIKSLDGGVQCTLDQVADGTEAFILKAVLDNSETKTPIVYVARDGQNLRDLADALQFVAPEIPVLELPAWDCLPYDRVSPSANAAAKRITALMALDALQKKPHPAFILTTVNALLQKAAPRDILSKAGFHAKAGSVLKMDHIVASLESQGFDRVGTVRDVGEYAVRGGILDLYAPSEANPVRLDFFGDTLESIRAFDAASQRTLQQLREFSLAPMSEITLTPEMVAQFRKKYIETFGAPAPNDALYASISEGRRFAGMEHWLSLFYDQLDTVFDYIGFATFVFEHMTGEAIAQRCEQIDDHFETRERQGDTGAVGGVPYKPMRPEALYLTPDEVRDASMRSALRIDMTPFDVPFSSDHLVLHAGSKTGRSFALERSDQNTNVFEAVGRHIVQLNADKKTVLIAGWSEGSLTRMMQVLQEHDVEGFAVAHKFDEVKDQKPNRFYSVLPIDHGFDTEKFTVISEQDILGDRLVRRSARKKRGADFISEVATLAAGDLVVHADHGIGRFVGLRTIEVGGAPHDCLEIHYDGDGRLLLPVENIELLSRFGSDSATASLDRLGGGAWQARKAKLKKKLLDMAADLIKIAAERATRGAPTIPVPEGLYGEFEARFAYDPTEDQASAINAVIDDLGKGTPMDRLICGDVGFGKTEVALRAAFLAAMEGLQVAVVVPTTLLARQHHKVFTERFSGLPLNVKQASRLVGTKELNATKAGLTNGSVDIVVGTHALLSDAVTFKNLGLLIIDEEQRFGVKHKERLKNLKSDVHVLTLSATPIPRTLQLALAGVRELSLITTAPVDRLAVRTFVSPFDTMVVRETLLRERFRGGQSFYVVPRVKDIPDVQAFLQSEVPELKVGVAHGQMTPGELDDVMNAFYDGSYDVLLSTTIVESGLDIPTANTMIVHRADMFGLSQLYQLRGRVGRSKVRAYALLTLPANKRLTDTAERRLKVLQSLENLGAGFQLASHDLDIRGGGNLLGEEQSGHIKEVGYELYQQMLEEAVAEMRGAPVDDSGEWSPQISVGTAILIPENYVPDLSLRLGLYRRLADLTTPAEIDAFGAELIDRFGPLPSEAEHLLKVVYVKALCRRANIERLDTGPKGAVVHFRDKTFHNPAALVQYIGEQGPLAKIRQDQSIAFLRDWATPEKRLSGAAMIVSKLAKFADQAN